MRGHVYQKYIFRFDEDCFNNDNETLRTYYFAKLNSFPTYKKIKNEILHNNNEYNLNIHNGIYFCSRLWECLMTLTSLNVLESTTIVHHYPVTLIFQAPSFYTERSLPHTYAD